MSLKALAKLTVDGKVIGYVITNTKKKETTSILLNKLRGVHQMFKVENLTIENGVFKVTDCADKKFPMVNTNGLTLVPGLFILAKEGNVFHFVTHVGQYGKGSIDDIIVRARFAPLINACICQKSKGEFYIRGTKTEIPEIKSEKIVPNKYLLDNVPLLNVIRVYHVGTMDISKKNLDSYEGSGLSVTNCPDAWQRINKGFTGGDTWELRKEKGKLVDYHALTKEQKAKIYKWGVVKQLVKPTKVYEVETCDDYVMSFDTKKAALVEAEDMYEDEALNYIKEINGYIGTEALIKLTYARPTTQLLNPIDLLSTLYFEQLYPNVDGIWWEDEYDPYSYSAPRGVIFNTKLHTWQKAKAGEYAEELEDGLQDILDNEEYYGY